MDEQGYIGNRKSTNPEGGTGIGNDENSRQPYKEEGVFDD
jgi:hypothetical protein